VPAFWCFPIEAGLKGFLEAQWHVDLSVMPHANRQLEASSGKGWLRLSLCGKLCLCGKLHRTWWLELMCLSLPQASIPQAGLSEKTAEPPKHMEITLRRKSAEGSCVPGLQPGCALCVHAMVEDAAV